MFSFEYVFLGFLNIESMANLYGGKNRLGGHFPIIKYHEQLAIHSK